MVDRLRNKLTRIHITLDCHRLVDIAHPIWWKDASGAHPAPFTIITAQDVRAGRWTTSVPSTFQRSLAYLDALEANGRYPACIWPEHCLIGDWGNSVWPELAQAVHRWERGRFRLTNFVSKGSNPWTEHFSGVQAEVPDPEDPDTQVNVGLIRTLEESDMVLLAGEALSHCLANTVRDIAAQFANPDYVRKLVLLEDASSPVTGFETFGADFVAEMTAKGMQRATTADILAD
jgi:nicotinamidase-related amidase